MLRHWLLLSACKALLLLAFVPHQAAAQATAQRGAWQGGRGLGISAAQLVVQEPVQKELGLSSEQTAKLAALPKGDGNQRGFRDMSEEERRQAMETRAQLVAEQDKALVGILDAKQQARLTQIRMQALGARALLEDDIATEMKMTSEQSEKLREGLQEVMQAARGGGGGPAQWRQQALEKVAEILTPEQKTAFKALQGPEFDLSALQLGMGGRRGGN